MKVFRLLLLLPFLLAASILALIAGLIGGKDWHVSISFSPNRGEKMVDGSIHVTSDL
jgi:hypothetical protein